MLTAKTIKNSQDVLKRVGFTFFIICLYRFAVFVPVPGIDLAAFGSFMSSKLDGQLFKMFNAFSGRALENMSIMALWLGPYISASIVMQLLSSSVPKFTELKKDGPSGQAKIKQYTRYLTLFLAIIQSYSIALGLEYMSDAIMYPGYFFRFSTVLSMVGSTLVAMWFSEQITSRGIGNGSSVLIFVNIISGVFSGALSILSAVNMGTISFWNVLLYLLVLLFIFVVVVALESVIRPVKIVHSERHHMVARMNMNHEMPIKLNVSGVLPPMFAQIFLGFIIFGLTNLMNLFGIGQYVAILNNGIINTILRAMMIVFFAFVYASMTFNPEEVAENLKNGRAFISRVSPGRQTKLFFEALINRITFFGAAYLALISILPDVFFGSSQILNMSGTSILIIVGVALEFFAHVSAHLSLSKTRSHRFRR